MFLEPFEAAVLSLASCKTVIPLPLFDFSPLCFDVLVDVPAAPFVPLRLSVLVLFLGTAQTRPADTDTPPPHPGPAPPHVSLVFSRQINGNLLKPVTRPASSLGLPPPPLPPPPGSTASAVQPQTAPNEPDQPFRAA